MTLDLVLYGCLGVAECRFRHSVDPDGGVTCSIAADLDAGFSSVQLQVAAAMPDLLTGACIGERDLSSESCITHPAVIDVQFGGDSGFLYGTSSAVQPPARFEAAAYAVFRACAPQFRSWDGGRYPYNF